MLLYRRLLHALYNHGLRGLLRRALDRLARRPTPPAPDAADPDLIHPFDLAHAADTSGYIPGEELGDQSSSTLSAPNLYNTAYYGISPSTLAAALAQLPLPPDAFTFVDLGCGKGRALLIAASLPFRQIVGVELAPDLCRVAISNTQSDSRISIHNHDATTFTLPDTPLVLYLYHPFLGPLLRRLLSSLERQLRVSPRETFLLYANPGYPRIIARFPFLQVVWDFTFPLSPEDAAADRHGVTEERYTLYRADLDQLPGTPELS